MAGRDQFLSRVGPKRWRDPPGREISGISDPSTEARGFCFRRAGRGGGRNGYTLRVVAEIGNIIATRRVIANPHKQQIPPLRCAPVGMTNYVNYFRGRH